MDYYKKELNRYLKKHKHKYSKEVIKYGKAFVDRVKDNKLLEEYFNNNSIGIYSFLSELLPISQHKFITIENEILDENEINKVFGSVIFSNEILKLLLKDEILIKGIDINDELIYELSDKAINYFDLKYGIKLNKNFSFRDIMIININNEEDDEEDFFSSLLN